MRLEASSCSSTSTFTPTTTPTPTSTILISGNNSSVVDKPWVRARRQTDPFSRTSIPELVRPARHSADSSPHAVTTDDYFGRGVPRTTSFSQSSTIISSEGLSNPALAGFTPRKINALKGQATPTFNNPTLIPTLTPTRSFPSSLPTLQVDPTTITIRDEPDPNDNDDACVSPSSHAAANSYSRLQSALSTCAEPRSPPHQKRGPASRSSYGIETSSGPPPALSTQRTLSQDKLWRSNNSLEAANTNNNNNQANKSPSQSPEPQADAPIRPAFSIDAVLVSEASNTPTPDKQQRPSSSPPKQQKLPEIEERSEMSGMESRSGRSSSYVNDRDRTIRGSDYINTDTSSRDSSNEENASKNEDLFLNIAKSTSDRRESSGRNGRRVRHLYKAHNSLMQRA
ncbi:hypothetical protein FQN54_003588 [Arachnomyces sp. PD_36]|nr:hypothetical protein FQN54_003588 [Arachnomyces sp. PD_36]